MSIIAGLGAALAITFIFYWQLLQRRRPEVSGATAGVPHHLALHPSAARCIDLVTDPHEAAVAMMVAIALTDGRITRRKRELIQSMITGHLGAPGNQAEKLLARGRSIAQAAGPAAETLLGLGPLLRRSLSVGERQEFVAMLRLIAVADGNLDAATERTLSSLAQLLRR